MGKKIFVSYKYSDTSVKAINGNFNTKVRDYVNRLEVLIGRENIYKGENDETDLSEFKDSTIWTKLKGKIFDSSITIVLISPKMKELYKNESDQWIPQEISYSLKELTNKKGGNKSLSNGLIYIVLPNLEGKYDYFISPNYFTGEKYKTDKIFNIMSDNMDKNNDEKSYAVIVSWENFISNANKYINIATEKQNSIENYEIVKVINEKTPVFW